MEHGGGHEIGSHKLAHFAGMTFHLDTLMMTWVTMVICDCFGNPCNT